MTTPPVEPSTPPPAEDAAPTRRRPWWRRWWAIAIAVVVVGLIIDVAVGPHTSPSSNAAAPSASTSAPAPTTTTPAATTPVRTTQRPATATTHPAAPVDTLTGYGATVARWNATHKVDPSYTAGSAYNPDPSLPPANGRTADTYVAVQPLGGRVTDYTINMAATPLSGAETVVGREFPADTRLLWAQPLTGCTIVEYASPTLRAALGDTDTGDAQVVYASQAQSTSTVDEATVSDQPGAAPDPAASC